MFILIAWRYSGNSSCDWFDEQDCAVRLILSRKNIRERMLQKDLLTATKQQLNQQNKDAKPNAQRRLCEIEANCGSDLTAEMHSAVDSKKVKSIIIL